MEKRTAAAISFLFLFLMASCQIGSSAESVQVEPSTSSIIDVDRTHPTPEQLMGNSKKDHPQLITLLVAQKSMETSAGYSTETTNQDSDATGSGHTRTTHPTELLTDQQSAHEPLFVSTEQPTVDFIEESSMGLRDSPIVSSTEEPALSVPERPIVIYTVEPIDGYSSQHIITTQSSTGETTKSMLETLTKYTSGMTTKVYSDQTAVEFMYESTPAIELSSSKYSIQWQDGKSTESPTMQTAVTRTMSLIQEPEDGRSVEFVASYIASSEKYTPTTSTNTYTEFETVPEIEKSTQSLAGSLNTEQSTETAPTISYTEQSSELTLETLTEQYLQPTKASSYFEQSTEPTNESSYIETSTNVITTGQPIETSFEASSTRPQNETVAANNDDSNDDWKIAVGVIIPLGVLITVLVGVYICYRKKYPVRMIIGREFGKFSNPNYQRRGHTPSLVREDADFVFSNNGTVSSVPSQEFNPVNKKIMYDNMGFVRDQHDDEEEKERKFLKNKSWLFKNAPEDSKNKVEEDAELTAESSFIANSSTNVKSRPDANRNETKTSTDTIKHKTVVVQETTPVIMPRRKKKAPEPPRNKGPFSQLNNEPKGQPATLRVTSETRDISKNVGNFLPRNFSLPESTDREPLKDKDGNREITKNVKSAVQLFKQKALNQGVKERSMSLTLDPIVLDGRSRSFSVDEPRTARKMSLYDEIVEATRLKFLAAQKITSSVSGEAGPVTAFVVGIDFRDRAASVTSSVLYADDDMDVASNPDEAPAARQTDFEEVNPQKTSTPRQHVVSTFYEDKFPSVRDETDHFNISTSHQVFSDSQNDEEIGDREGVSGSEIIDMTSVLSVSAAPEDSSYHDNTDAAFLGAFSHADFEHNQVSALQRSTSLTSESSSISSGHEDPEQGSSNVIFTFDLDTPIFSTSGDAVHAEENAIFNMRKVLRPEEENYQRYIENDKKEDVSNDASNEANTRSVNERRQQFKLMTPEMKNSSSTESVVGSSESSRGIPSDDEEEEDIAKYFPSSIETLNYNKDDATSNKVIDGASSNIKQPLSRLHGDGDAPEPVSPTAEDDNSHLAVFHMQYSNSSSDSSDSPPRKEFNLLSRERQNSTDVEESLPISVVSNENEDRVEIAILERSEGSHDGAESGTYELLDYVDDDEVDV